MHENKISEKEVIEAITREAEFSHFYDIYDAELAFTLAEIYKDGHYLNGRTVVKQDIRKALLYSSRSYTLAKAKNEPFTEQLCLLGEVHLLCENKEAAVMYFGNYMSYGVFDEAKAHLLCDLGIDPDIVEAAEYYAFDLIHEREVYLDKPIVECDFSVRTTNTLFRLNAHTVQDIFSLDFRRLASLKWIGKKVLYEISDFVIKNRALLQEQQN